MQLLSSTNSTYYNIIIHYSINRTHPTLINDVISKTYRATIANVELIRIKDSLKMINGCSSHIYMVKYL